MMQQKAQITSLTGMRGIAAVGVLLHHIIIYLMPAAGIAVGAHTQFFRNGYLWVDFFFILSGFLLAVLYLQDFSERLQDFSERKKRFFDFMVFRFARIYPLHVFVLMLFVAVQLAYVMVGDADAFTGKFTFQDMVKHLLLLQAFQISPGGTTWNGPAWSISAEWGAYLCFPLFVMLMGKLSARRDEIVALLLCLAGVIAIDRSTDFQLDVTGVLGLLRCGLEFFAGMVLARGFYRSSAADWLAQNAVQWLLVVGLLLSLHLDHFDVVSVVIMAALILSVARASAGPASALSHPHALFIGKISYSIYMTHWFVFLLIEKAGTQIFDIYIYDTVHPGGWLSGLLLVVAVVGVFSVLTYNFVEDPMRRRLPEWLGVRKPAVVN